MNLLFSVLLLRRFGFIGVIIGTTISMLATTVWSEAVIVYRHVLRVPSYKFFEKYLLYLGALLFVGTVTYSVCSCIKVCGFVTFVVRAMLCVITCNLCFALLFGKTQEFAEIVRVFRNKYMSRFRKIQ